MSEEKIPYGEIICEAVDTIVSKRMESLNYDITTNCLVTDNTYKAWGKYTVSNNSIQFEAYSTITTLEVGDSVLVNIPKGDYNNQKTILNKVITSSEDNTYLTYNSPLNNMLKFTDNIATVTEGSILANRGNTDGSSGKTDRKQIGDDIAWSDYQGFTMMGVAASFETNLGDYDTIAGHYGLLFEFKLSDGRIYEYKLDVDDMNGNPYRFIVASQQEKLFNISELANVASLTVYLYQEQDFVDGDGNKIPTQSQGDKITGVDSVVLQDNIKLVNLNIVLGYELGSFSDDHISILIDNLTDNDFDNSYGYSALVNEKLKRRLRLRWIHKIDETTYHVIDPEEDKGNFRVKWLHYRIGANPSSVDVIDYGGPNWEEIGDNEINLVQDVSLNVNEVNEKFKVMCSYYENEAWTPYIVSDEITFVNTRNTADMTTINAISGLSLTCLDGQAGNYYLYNTGGELINEGLGQGYIRSVAISYNGVALNDTKCDLYGKVSKVKWIIPVQRTMIEWIRPSDKIGIVEDTDENNKKKDYATWTLDGANINSGLIMSYSIKNIWVQTNALNEITCEVTDTNNITYKASWIFFFGVNGSSGSNYTVIVEYLNGSGSIPVVNGNSRQVVVVAKVYDKNNNELTDIADKISWEVKGREKDNLNIGTSNQAQYIINPRQNVTNVNFLVLAATYKSDKVEATGYLPLSYRNADLCDCYDGPRKIIYNSLGTPIYNSNVCQLRKGSEVIDNVKWDIAAPTDNWELVSLKDGAISASSVYQKTETPYCCLYATRNNTLLWSQTIFILQTAYDFAVTNSWDGNVSLNNNNSVMAPMVGAGKKTSTGKFSGVLMGTMDNTGKDSASVVGLYGISNGQVTYSLTEDGVATFKSVGEDSGEVQLGGNTNIIKSAAAVKDINKGMVIDIDKGTLQVMTEKLQITKNGIRLYDELQYTGDKFVAYNADKNIIIDFINKQFKFSNGTITIDFSNDNFITLPNQTIIKKDGSIMYKGDSLDNYINNCIKTLVKEDSLKTTT